MTDQYLTIPKREGGYYSVLEAFRTGIPLATKEHYEDLDFIVNGELPEELKQHLPIFGLTNALASSSDPYALNSGGRGVLLSDGNTHIRFKGCDIDGSITRRVARSPNNHITDITRTAESLGRMSFDTRPLHYGGTFNLPTHVDKPFSFFLEESVTRERDASEALADFFASKGFLKPYSFEASITYPGIQWQGQPCSTLVFGLPSPESDLRFEEIFRLGFLHLKFASPQELRDLEEDLGDFLLKLTSWHGFVTAAMEEKRLAPVHNSHQHQNYVLCHVTGTEIGASRVDHTSTNIDEESSKAYTEMMRQQGLFFSGLHTTLLHALELAKQEHLLDQDRFTSCFDRAYKWKPWEPWDPRQIEGMAAYIDSSVQAFERGYQEKDPIPIPQSELINIVQRIASIRIDRERQRIVDESREALMRELMRGTRTEIEDRLLRMRRELGGDLSR